ncbi:MAG: aldo/keto reductase [Phototrophicales bacterium]|nr:aldo/keto reductase [Phototrophicales bacterium]
MMRYKLLGKSGLRVSELCLGTMTFGADWGWGADKPEAQKIFDAFMAAGGNFIDTSHNYTNGTSERFVGEFIHPKRDEFVVATKYTLQMATENRSNPNLGGNSRKTMRHTVESSLKRLNTDYIDILYLHAWDFTTPIEEVLRAVDDLVTAGKVLYFAFSDTPAWIVSQAVAIAEIRGWTRPVAFQFPYSALSRAAERDVMPMSRTMDLTMLTWGVLSGGALTGKYNTDNTDQKRNADASDSEKKMAETILALASEINRSPSQIAINWVRQQVGQIIPILGARTHAQIVDNLGVLDFALTDDQLQKLRDATDFKVDFPLSFLTADYVRHLIFGHTFSLLDNHRPSPDGK